MSNVYEVKSKKKPAVKTGKYKVNANNRTLSKVVSKENTIHYEHITRLGMPISDKYIDVLIASMRKWIVEDTQSLRINQFCRFVGIPRHTFYVLCDRYPRLKEEYEEMKLVLADRLFMGAVYVDRGMRDAPSLRYIHSYDSEFLDADAQVARIKAEAAKEDEAQTVRVFMEKFTVDDKK